MPTAAPPPSIMVTLHSPKPKPRTTTVSFSNQRPQTVYSGSLEESRRATIALNHMLMSLRSEGRSTSGGSSSNLF